MTYEIVSVRCAGPGFECPDKDRINYREIDNRDNRMTPCQAYQYALETSEYDVLIYVHDDLTVHDPYWLSRVLGCFIGGVSDGIVAVGLGGALRLGSPDLYKRPYDIQQMARAGYHSNQTDFRTHGERITSVCRVAVLDAFCMAVRRDWLACRCTSEYIRNHYGWPVDRLSHHCLDLWLACEAARDQKEIWMVGASCTHHGGGTSTKEAYARAAWLQGGSVERDHQSPHKWLYEEYRDVLPIEVR